MKVAENDQAAQALIERFDARLRSGASATAVLEQWCTQHAIAPGVRVTARATGEPPPPCPPDVATALMIGGTEQIAYRHVELICGDIILSDAQNWYVPHRLTSVMNEQLATTTIPFGSVVASILAARETISSQYLWDGHGAVPREILAHRALIFGPRDIPIAVVNERYTSAILPPATR